MENENTLDLFNPKKAELKSLAKEFNELVIMWIDDKDWYKKVHLAEMTVKKHRTTIEGVCKDYTRWLDAKKKEAWELRDELIWIIKPIEDYLKEQKAIIDDEKEAIKQKKLEDDRLKLSARVDRLRWFWYFHLDLEELQKMSDKDYKNLVEEKKAIFNEAEKDRILKEEKEKQEKEDFRKQQEQLKIDQDKLDAEKKIIQDEKDRKQKEEDDRILNESVIETLKNTILSFWDYDALIRLKEDYKINRIEYIWDLKETFDKKLEELKILKDEDEKIKKENEEKARQEEIEKDKKYTDFLEKNKWLYDDKIKRNWKVILIKFIDEIFVWD